LPSPGARHRVLLVGHHCNDPHVISREKMTYVMNTPHIARVDRRWVIRTPMARRTTFHAMSWTHDYAITADEAKRWDSW
jgi:hypothetical protein